MTPSLHDELEGPPPGETPNRALMWWTKNSIAVNILMVVGLLAGIVGFLQMDRVVFPAFGWNGVSVNVSWPGASAQDVEEQIVLRIEEVLADLEGIEEVNANASEGFANVNIEARRDVDILEFVDQVKIRVDGINNLPPSSFRPIVRRWESQEIFMGLALSGPLEPIEMKRLADRLRDQIALLPGASRAVVWATLSEEVTIEVSDDALRRYGLTFDEVARAIDRSSINASSGNVRTAVGDVQLRARNLADSQADFENIVVRQTETGALIRVGDVATVIDGFVDEDLHSTFNGAPMALIALPTLQENMDVTETDRAVKKFLKDVADDLPPGVTLQEWWNDSEIFDARMQLLAENAALGLILVFICLILFLHPVVAFWTTMGITVTFAATFAVLPHLDVSLNMLSTFAFLLVIGIVVDDAIIVGENIHNMVERGERGVTASTLGTQLVAKPVIFAVLTTMMAFAPWMMLSGPEVQFTRQISLVVIFTLLFSLIESLFILPNHLTHLKPLGKGQGIFRPFFAAQNLTADSMVWFAQRIYRPVAELAIRARYITLTFFVCLFVLSIATWTVAGAVKFRFMPEIESEFVQVQIDLPQGTPFSRVMQVVEQFETAQLKYAEEVNATYEGEGELVRSVAVIAEGTGLQAWVRLAPPESRPRGVSTAEVAEGMRAATGPIPDAEEIVFDATLNQGGDGVRFALRGQDLDELRAAAGMLKTQLVTYDGVVDVRDSLTSAAEEARISLKPGAETLGFTLAEVTRQVRQAFFGEEVQRLPREGDDVRVMVRFPKAERDSLDSLLNFRLRTADGREVPLASVADVTFEPGTRRITRLDRQRSINVAADADGDTSELVRKDLGENFWPQFEARYPGVSRVSRDASQGQSEFNQEVLLLQGLMLCAMFVLLAVAFGSLFQPLLIMTAIPFAVTGAILGHLFTGVPLALFSFFGIGAAAGVVVNDNLVLIDYINRLRKQGVGAFQALVEAGVSRFRPIILTSITTIFGVLPLMAERSTDAQFLKPMVVSLGFAVLFALFLTLFLVPALYAIGIDINRYVRWAFGGEPHRPFGSSYDPHATLEGPMGVAAVGDRDGEGRI